MIISAWGIVIAGLLACISDVFFDDEENEKT